MSQNPRPKISAYIATSMDGYIAKENHGLDWLENFAPPMDAPKEDYGFKEFVNGVDTLIMGRHTYQIVLTAPQWPYPDKRVVVLSSSLTSVHEKAELYQGSIVELIARLGHQGTKHIYADGGITICSLLNEKLIDELILSIIPVILGSGIRLFNNRIRVQSWYNLTSSKSYSNGLVQLHYEMAK